MDSVVGTFKSRVDAERAANALRSSGIPLERINQLSPGATAQQVERVPVTDAEPPGIGMALGAAVGGSVGIAGGAVVGGILASALLPGVGVVAAVGALAATVLGALGAIGGGAAGKAADSALSDGIPGDELYVYEDALRQGRTVLIAEAEDEKQAAVIRQILDSSGAETIDKARHMWWIGLRDAEKERYNAAGGDFDRDEDYFHRGFEAALRVHQPAKTYDESRDKLEWLYSDSIGHTAFREGFERGQAYLRARAATPASRN